MALSTAGSAPSFGPPSDCAACSTALLRALPNALTRTWAGLPAVTASPWALKVARRAAAGPAPSSMIPKAKNTAPARFMYAPPVEKSGARISQSGRGCQPLPSVSPICSQVRGGQLAIGERQRGAIGAGLGARPPGTAGRLPVEGGEAILIQGRSEVLGRVVGEWIGFEEGGDGGLVLEEALREQEEPCISLA